MKKIMIMLAAVACAAVVQAATISWTVTAGPQPAGAHLKNYSGGVYTDTVYLVLASEKSNIVDALNAGNSFSSVDSAKTAVAMTGGISTRSVTSDTLTTSSTDFMALLVDVDADGNTVYKFSTAMTVTPSADPSVPAQFSFAANTDFAGSWTTVKAEGEGGGSGAIPEPTSGLLLVLGVAGLALRRRRA